MCASLDLLLVMESLESQKYSRSLILQFCHFSYWKRTQHPIWQLISSHPQNLLEEDGEISLSLLWPMQLPSMEFRKTVTTWPSSTNSPTFTENQQQMQLWISEYEFHRRDTTVFAPMTHKLLSWADTSWAFLANCKMEVGPTTLSCTQPLLVSIHARIQWFPVW